jgi:hypothetical protein
MGFAVTAQAALLGLCGLTVRRPRRGIQRFGLDNDKMRAREDYGQCRIDLEQPAAGEGERQVGRGGPMRDKEEECAGGRQGELTIGSRGSRRGLE